MKTLVKLNLTGVFATSCRVAGQMLLQVEVSLMMKPSIFAEKRSLPNVFVTYGVIVYRCRDLKGVSVL